MSLHEECGVFGVIAPEPCDVAYEIFIEEKNIPHSIYEPDGADKRDIDIPSDMRSSIPVFRDRRQKLY